ncbi:MAG: hypothetical protein ACREPA_03095 [Candidatus Dormibacteraceae bacterium]
MTLEDGPFCPSHDPAVSMSLHSIETESGRAFAMVLFECPNCGHQRRMPLAGGPED